MLIQTITVSPGPSAGTASHDYPADVSDATESWDLSKVKASWCIVSAVAHFTYVFPFGANALLLFDAFGTGVYDGVVDWEGRGNDWIHSNATDGDATNGNFGIQNGWQFTPTPPATVSAQQASLDISYVDTGGKPCDLIAAGAHNTMSCPPCKHHHCHCLDSGSTGGAGLPQSLSGGAPNFPALPSAGGGW